MTSSQPGERGVRLGFVGVTMEGEGVFGGKEMGGDGG